jgi:hypothetical protein
MWEGMGWASPSHFSRCVWEIFEESPKNCLPDSQTWSVCQISAPPTSKKHREPCPAISSK